MQLKKKAFQLQERKTTEQIADCCGSRGRKRITHDAKRMANTFTEADTAFVIVSF
jgi:hypothetical protein